jgi:hypothetical protein
MNLCCGKTCCYTDKISWKDMNIVQDSVTRPLNQTAPHMWLDKIVCLGMAGRCGGLLVDDTCIKWVVTLLALD